MAARKKKATKAESTSIVPVTPELQAELDNKRERLAVVLQRCAEIPVETPEGMTAAKSRISTVRKLKAEHESQRKEITGPLNAALRATNKLFKPVADFYDAIDKALTRRVGDEELRQLAAQSKALAEVEAGADDEETLAVAHALDQADPEDSALSAGRVVIEVEIVDPEAVPRPFCEPSEKLLRTYAEARGVDNVSVPGVKFTKRMDYRRKS